MLFLLALLTATYFVVVGWVWRGKRRAGDTRSGPVVTTALPAEDQPPSSAIGWPPGGASFSSYVDEGFAALDAYLSEGYAA